LGHGHALPFHLSKVAVFSIVYPHQIVRTKRRRQADCAGAAWGNREWVMQRRRAAATAIEVDEQSPSASQFAPVQVMRSVSAFQVV